MGGVHCDFFLVSKGIKIKYQYSLKTTSLSLFTLAVSFWDIILLLFSLLELFPVRIICVFDCLEVICKNSRRVRLRSRNSRFASPSLEKEEQKLQLS